MRTFLLLVTIIFPAASACAATVLLTVTGRVSETDAASFFPNPPVVVGDQWTAAMTWHYPTIGTQIIDFSYFDPLGSLRFTVNGHSWDAAHLAGSLGGTSWGCKSCSAQGCDPGIM